MKKYLIIAVIFAATLVTVSTVKAQETYHPYWSTALSRYAMASQQARQTAARGRRHGIRHTRRKRAARHRTRRVSSIENMLVPKSKFDADLPKRIEIA